MLNRSSGQMTATGTDPLQAAIYCRMSLARFGDTTKVDDQERICRELAAQLGWHVAEVYTDNSISAWNKRVKRPGWLAMLDAVDAGQINAIITYHGDRLTRQPRDLEKLIDLGENKGVRLASPTGTRNLGSRDDRAMLRVIAAFAVNESDAKSDRQKSQYARWRLKGRVVTGGRGGRMFGFDTDGVSHFPPDRCSLITREEVVEPDIVRDVFARVLAGEAVRHIARDLAARGITTTTGKRMHPLAVRRMISSPRYAGLMPDGESAAAWEPIVSREDWETANAFMSGHAYVLTPGHNARRYLLSGLARCGECGHPMQVLAAYTSGAKSRNPGRNVAARYGCLVGECRKVYRNVAHLDAYVTRRTVSRMSHPLNRPARLPATPGVIAEIQALTGERATLEEMVADHTKGRVHLLLARLDSVDARLTQLRELTAADAASRLIDRYIGISEDEFKGLPLPVRRGIIAACYTVTVLPASGRGPGFRDEDVRLTPAPGSIPET
jgi:site-specific DNA recombinase